MNQRDAISHVRLQILDQLDSWSLLEVCVNPVDVVFHLNLSNKTVKCHLGPIYCKNIDLATVAKRTMSGYGSEHVRACALTVAVTVAAATALSP